VTPGHSYTLRFAFSEVWWTTAGSRRFDVLVGGARVLTGVDAFEAANAKFVGITREVNVTAASSSLAVSLVPTADNAITAALEVSCAMLRLNNCLTLTASSVVAAQPAKS
jgi:hypothetical protein